jgi:hypothetical protein
LLPRCTPILLGLLSGSAFAAADPDSGAGSPPPEAPVLRGYEFTISASATDPNVTRATPAGSFRELYLWVLCAQPGLAVLDCEADGTLPILGFEPLNGALNVGNAQHLLLAVPDCLSGYGINQVLGKWMVDDQGGSLCLAAPADGNFVAIDCDPFEPVSTIGPGITGFSSSGEPCRKRRMPCPEVEPGDPAGAEGQADSSPAPESKK